MTNKDDVWFLANAGVAGAVLAMLLGSHGAMPPLQKSTNKTLV